MSLAKITEGLKFAGDVSIRKLEIVGSNNYIIDITKQAVKINVYEDLFSPFTTLSIVVRESVDFITALPLKGEEIINVEIGTPTMVKQEHIIKGKFYIYKLSDRMEMNKKSTVYVLHCISYEAMVDLNTRKSKAYRGRISDIASEIIGKDGLNTDKNINIETSINNTKYVSNYWSPVKNLNYIASIGMNMNSSPSYVFFENRTGFNFVSLESLYGADVKQNFIKDDYVRDTDARGNSYINPEEDYKRILDFKVKTTYDSLATIPSGTYASRMYTYDLLKKKYTITDYSAADNYLLQKHLNDKALISDYKPVSSLNAMYNQTKHYAVHDGFADTSISKTIQERSSLLQLLDSNKIEITVLGRTDYTIGQKVNVKLPRPVPFGEKDSNDELVDASYSGNYIIVAINHNITNSKHEVTLELAKDSYIG